ETFELHDLGRRSPAEKPGLSIAKIGIRDLIEPARGVEAPGDLVGDCLVLREAVAARRSNRLVVKAHRIELATFDARDLRGNESSTVGKVFRRDLGPMPKLAIMTSQAMDLPACSLGE